VFGAITFGDRIKPEAASFVAELKQRGMRTLLVSGDAIAEALPDKKIDVARRLQEQGSTVAMIGAGVNAAPSLAQADLGIALGSGTDIAMKAAPVVITSGRLEPVLQAFQIAARTVRTCGRTSSEPSITRWGSRWQWRES
jgi:P-type E1-E2 ATPase